MSSKVSLKKLKKPLNLPLGKGACQKELDLSHIRLPMETSIFGLKQVLNLFETATNEVKSYLAYECDLMYECRICRTIFRSLANFILHKRKYCRDKFNSLGSSQCSENNGISVIQSDISEANKIVLENDAKNNVSSKHLDPIIEKLLKKQKHKEFVEKIKNTDLSEENEVKSEPPDSVILEPMSTSNVAVFQTLTSKSNLGETEFMKSEVMEIHSIFEDSEGIIGPDGKLLSSNNNNKQKKLYLSCTECNKKFTTKKTLSYHVKFQHNDSRLVYPCPLCKEFLSNAYGVYRHLLKVHRKTSAQIRKYRNQVHNSAICRRKEDLHSRMRKDSKENLTETKEGNDKDNEWLDNVEGDNDIQMCGGCGKRFERKAALTSHSVMCTKRIAICNSIKENNAKKKEADDRETRLKIRSSRQFSAQNNGSARRKPENLITYKTKLKNSEFQSSETESKPRCNDIISNANGDDFVRVELCTEITEESIILSSDYENSDNDEQVCDSKEKDEGDSPVIGYDSNSLVVEADLSGSPSQKSDNSSKLSEGSHSPFRGFERSSCSRKLPPLTKIFSVEPSQNIKDVDYKSCENDFNENCEILNAQPCTVEEGPITVRRTLRSRLTNGQSDNGSIFSDKIKTFDDKINCNTETFNDSSHMVSIDLIPKFNSVNENDLSGNERLYSLFTEHFVHDPDSSDFKSVIKEICDERYQEINEESSDEAINREECTDFQKPDKDNSSDDSNLSAFKSSRIEECTDYDFSIEISSPNSNTDQLKKASCKSQNIELTKNAGVKRQCSISPSDSLKKKKILCSTEVNDELLTESEDEVFISKITPYTDLNNSICSLCNTEFNSLSALLLHMSLHFSWYRYQCSKCAFMSFKKHDCESHVHKEHQLPFHKIENVVLPLPTWKSTLLSNGVSTSNSIIDVPAQIRMKDEEEDNQEENDETKEYLQKDNIISFIDLTAEIDDEENTPKDSQCIEEQSSNSFEEKPIVEVNVLPDIASLSVSENDVTKKKIKNTLGVEHVRPPRNRVKSIKTSQKDFIYDLDVVRNKTQRSISKSVEDFNDSKTK